MDICNLCKNKITENDIISWVHKIRPYGGYSKYLYPRYFCSKNCLDYYNKNHKCNLCGVVEYDYRNYSIGNDGYTYCDDIDEMTIGDDTCYNQYKNKLTNISGVLK